MYKTLAIVFRLITFFLSAAIFLCNIPFDNQESFTYVCFKCLPIAVLVWFILKQNGFSWRDEHAYSRKVLIALTLSVAADAFICFEKFFLFAVGIFTFVQIIYISAFGFTPFNHLLGCIIYGIELYAINNLIGYLKSEFLKLVLSVYVTFLFTMIWRSVALVDSSEKKNCWQRIFGAAGSIMFGVSDVLLLYGELVSKSPYGNLIVMSTYYAAQFGLAMSSIDTHLVERTDSIDDKKKSK